jgi:hypothetical protein
VPVNNWSDFRTKFAPSDDLPGLSNNYLFHAVNGFFQNRGGRCFVVNLGTNGSVANGVKLLEANDEISIVAALYSDVQSQEAVTAHCEKMQDRVCIHYPPNVDNTELLKTVAVAPAAAPKTPKAKDSADKPAGGSAADKPPDGGLRPRSSEFAAFYFPWLVVQDPANPNAFVQVPPSGHIAGIWSRVDGTRGVHKAPANEAPAGVLNLTYRVTAEEQGPLNSLGVNCIRQFAGVGPLVWGARTLADQSSSCRYINVRRTLIFIEQSILRATRWAVFEPNDRTLWGSIKCAVTGFLNNVYRDGALMGRTPEEAFFVKCDEECNPPESIDMGQVNVVVGVAIVKPAEFVVFKIGQTQSGAKVEAL